VARLAFFCDFAETRVSECRKQWPSTFKRFETIKQQAVKASWLNLPTFEPYALEEVTSSCLPQIRSSWGEQSAAPISIPSQTCFAWH